MNKKLFLLALPALMVLSGCSGVSASPKANLMAEDTLAHEEIFGEAVKAGEFGLKKGAPYKLDKFTSDFVKIGYQIKFAENGSGTADDTISVRFVAAIKNQNVEVQWHRGLAQKDGAEGANPGSGWKYKFEDTNEIKSKTMYSTLLGGGATLTVDSGEYAGYAGFAIYTLR